MTLKRNTRLDTIKGLLIILVIMGHFIEECPEHSGFLNEGFHTFIYIFHIPLFVFISGYFSSIKKDFSSLILSMKSIFKAVIIFHLLSWLYIYAYNVQPLNLARIITPYWTLWYLVSLIFWRLLLQFSPKILLDNPKRYIVLAFCVAAVCGFMIYGRIFSIQRTINFFPFFLMGYFVKQGKIKITLWNKYVSFAIIFTVLVLALANIVPADTWNLVRGADHYWLPNLSGKIYILALSILTTISLYNIAIPIPLLSFIGRDSLLYYTFHGLLLKCVFVPIIIRYDFSTNLLCITAYCALMILSIYILGKLKPLRFLVC